MKRLIAAGAVAAMAAAGIGLALMTPAGAATKPTRAQVVALASANVGKGDCSKNSRGGTGYETSCTNHEYWCADFAKWVWASLGLKTADLTAAAHSFYTYGTANKTFSHTPQVGDAAVFADTDTPTNIHHVAIVSQVNSNGTIETISGDWNGESGSMAHFADTSHVTRNTPAYSAKVNTHPSVMDQWLIGFISPVGLAPAAPPKPKSTPPTGSVYSLTHSGPGEWSVHGWAADPDHKTTAIQVRVLVNNRTKIVRANLNQPDVAQHKPGYGPNHGFNFTFGVPSTPERSHAEIDALDPVTHTWTRISHNWTLSGGQPVGHFESATRTGNKVTVTGWAIDPNLHGPSAVLVKIGNNSDRFLANTNRPDVGHAFPRWGNTHGYHDTFGIPTAATQVCITNLNSGPGTTGTTTCRKL
jgi:surface antigen